MFRKVVSILVAITFIISSIGAPAGAQTVLNLPVPGTMVTSTSSFLPMVLKGIQINPDDPLQFDFLIDRGDKMLEGEAFKVESTKLIKYFLAALTIPEDQMWVNLSPYEKNRIIPEEFGQTEMGRDLLAQDYMLKQLSSSLLYPEHELGQKFWKRVQAKTKEKYGNAEISANAMNKIWIVPEESKIYEHAKGAFIVESKLKVMLEEDYEALAQQRAKAESRAPARDKALDSNILREILIPEIEREVNEGEIFANLRQIYNSMLLATWYKSKLKDSLLGKTYVDQAKVDGVNIQDPAINQRIYDQYVAAFKQGVYDFIKEEYNPEEQNVIPRKYFSGGMNVTQASAMVTAPMIPEVTAEAQKMGSRGSAAMATFILAFPALFSNPRSIIDKVIEQGYISTKRERAQLLSAIREIMDQPGELPAEDKARLQKLKERPLDNYGVFGKDGKLADSAMSAGTMAGPPFAARTLVSQAASKDRPVPVRNYLEDFGPYDPPPDGVAQAAFNDLKSIVEDNIASKTKPKIKAILIDFERQEVGHTFPFTSLDQKGLKHFDGLNQLMAYYGHLPFTLHIDPDLLEKDTYHEDLKEVLDSLRDVWLTTTTRDPVAVTGDIVFTNLISGPNVVFEVFPRDKMLAKGLTAKYAYRSKDKIQGYHIEDYRQNGDYKAAAMTAAVQETTSAAMMAETIRWEQLSKEDFQEIAWRAAADNLTPVYLGGATSVSNVGLFKRTEKNEYYIVIYMARSTRTKRNERYYGVLLEGVEDGKRAAEIFSKVGGLARFASYTDDSAKSSIGRGLKLAMRSAAMMTFTPALEKLFGNPAFPQRFANRLSEELGLGPEVPEVFDFHSGGYGYIEFDRVHTDWIEIDTEEGELSFGVSPTLVSRLDEIEMVIKRVLTEFLPKDPSFSPPQPRKVPTTTQERIAAIDQRLKGLRSISSNPRLRQAQLSRKQWLKMEKQRLLGRGVPQPTKMDLPDLKVRLTSPEVSQRAHLAQGLLESNLLEGLTGDFEDFRVTLEKMAGLNGTIQVPKEYIEHSRLPDALEDVSEETRILAAIEFLRVNPGSSRNHWVARGILMLAAFKARIDQFDTITQNKQAYLEAIISDLKSYIKHDPAPPIDLSFDLLKGLVIHIVEVLKTTQHFSEVESLLKEIYSDVENVKLTGSEVLITYYHGVGYNRERSPRSNQAWTESIAGMLASQARVSMAMTAAVQEGSSAAMVFTPKIAALSENPRFKRDFANKLKEKLGFADIDRPEFSDWEKGGIYVEFNGGASVRVFKKHRVDELVISTSLARAQVEKAVEEAFDELIREYKEGEGEPSAAMNAEDKQRAVEKVLEEVASVNQGEGRVELQIQASSEYKGDIRDYWGTDRLLENLMTSETILGLDAGNYFITPDFVLVVTESGSPNWKVVGVYDPRSIQKGSSREIRRRLQEMIREFPEGTSVFAVELRPVNNLALQLSIQDSLNVYEAASAAMVFTPAAMMVADQSTQLLNGLKFNKNGELVISKKVEEKALKRLKQIVKGNKKLTIDQRDDGKTVVRLKFHVQGEIAKKRFKQWRKYIEKNKDKKAIWWDINKVLKKDVTDDPRYLAQVRVDTTKIRVAGKKQDRIYIPDVDEQISKQARKAGLKVSHINDTAFGFAFNFQGYSFGITGKLSEQIIRQELGGVITDAAMTATVQKDSSAAMVNIQHYRQWFMDSPFSSIMADIVAGNKEALPDVEGFLVIKDGVEGRPQSPDALYEIVGATPVYSKAGERGGYEADFEWINDGSGDGIILFLDGDSQSIFGLRVPHNSFNAEVNEVLGIGGKSEAMTSLPQEINQEIIQFLERAEAGLREIPQEEINASGDSHAIGVLKKRGYRVVELFTYNILDEFYKEDGLSRDVQKFVERFAEVLKGSLNIEDIYDHSYQEDKDVSIRLIIKSGDENIIEAIREQIKKSRKEATVTKAINSRPTLKAVLQFLFVTIPSMPGFLKTRKGDSLVKYTHDLVIFDKKFLADSRVDSLKGIRWNRIVANITENVNILRRASKGSEEARGELASLLSELSEQTKTAKEAVLWRNKRGQIVIGWKDNRSEEAETLDLTHVAQFVLVEDGSRLASEDESAAMGASKQSPTGGVDLNAALGTMDIQKDGEGVVMPEITQEMIDKAMNASGFVPVLIDVNMNISVPQLFLMLGLKEEDEEGVAVAAI